MTADRSDILITSDLAALAEDCRRDLVPVDAAVRGAYRDDRPGAEARRDALAAERRRELALMPLALSQVFAHRVARAAAGGMALLCAATLALLIVDSMVLRIVAWAVPGINILVCATLAGAAVLAAYIVGGWVAERIFAKKMRDAIATSGDAYADLDHLGEGPLAVAHALVRRADGWAVGLALAGAAAVVPLFGFVGLVLTWGYGPSYWSQIGVLNSYAVVANVGAVGFAIVVTLVAAISIGRACDRARGEEVLGWTRILRHWGVLPLAFVIGIATMIGAAHAAEVGSFGSEGTRFLNALGGAATVFLPAAWGVLFWRDREHARCDGSRLP